MATPAPSAAHAPGAALRSAARAAFWTLTLLALPAAALSLAAWFTSTPFFLAQLSPFRVQAAALLATHAAFCLVLRRGHWAALFAALGLLNLAAVHHGSRLLSSAPPGAAPLSAYAAPGAEASVRPLKILYANVLTSNTDPSPLLALIAAEQPDLVALLEIDARWERQLTPLLAADYPHRFARTREDNFGLALYARVQPGGGRVEFFADVETPSFDFTFPHPDGDIRMLLTHPLPPGDAGTTRLRDDHLGDLVNWHHHVAGLTATDAPSQPILILGDLNATPWCPPLRRLLAATGLRTAASDHRVVAATWPVALPFLRIPLDHALLNSTLACVAYRVGPDIGSDHFPLVLEVRPSSR